MLVLLTTLLPFLEALSCVFTLWGVVNVPSFTDTVVTYGATGDEMSPDYSMWINSIGSLSFGLVSWGVTSWFKGSAGFKSELYTAIVALLSSKNSSVALGRVFLAVLAFAQEKWVDPTNANDVAVVNCIKQWISEKIAGTPLPLPPPTK